MWRGRSVFSITAVAVIGIQTAPAAQTSNNTAEVEGVTVTGQATGSLTSVSPEESAQQKTAVPGAFTLKTNEDMELGRASNLEDLLQRTPGVFLQSENGSEVSKISIRGSGITSEDEPLFGELVPLNTVRGPLAGQSISCRLPHATRRHSR